MLPETVVWSLGCLPACSRVKNGIDHAETVNRQPSSQTASFKSSELAKCSSDIAQPKICVACRPTPGSVTACDSYYLILSVQEIRHFRPCAKCCAVVHAPVMIVQRTG